ncbi:MAG: hypothetical protein ACTHNY_01740 [Solirubrobacterales bacterium]
MAGTASEARAADWRGITLPMPDEIHSKLLGMSCPSPDLCVAVGETSVVATSTHPGDGASAWHSDRLNVDTVGSEPGRGLQSTLYSVSCPSERLCVAVTFDGYVVTSTNPTGGTGAWQPADVDGSGRDTHLMAVSCPTEHLCVAVSGERNTAGKILTSTDPTGGPGAWSELQLDETLDLRGVSCGTPTLCVAVAESGRMLVSSNPSGGASAWREIQPGGPGDMRGISCAGSLLCVAGNFGGNLLTSANPLAGASAWSSRNGGGSVLITGVSCMASRRCAAVDNNGDVLTSLDPLDPGESWSFENLSPFRASAPGEGANNAIFSIACPATEFCAAAGAGGSIYTSDDAFARRASAGGGGASTGPRARGPKRPRTKLARVDRRHTSIAGRWTRLRFRFHAIGKARGFECRLDKRRFRGCRSPKVYKHVSLGRHVFRVRAIGSTGLRGPIAKELFRVVQNRNARALPAEP